MIFEFLRFRVPTGGVEAFVDRNEEVWTPALRDHPGFLGRDVLRSQEHPDVVVVLVRWESRAAMESFPEETQRRLEDKITDLITDQERQIYERVVLD